jgi:hypothetical protein
LLQTFQQQLHFAGPVFAFKSLSPFIVGPQHLILEARYQGRNVALQQVLGRPRTTRRRADYQVVGLAGHGLVDHAIKPFLLGIKSLERHVEFSGVQ